ncbi:hypothetical protein [Roseomonas sp. BN140053]|uniref:hypothetical protein n=1 Tax=Roseomonas sp. BN140053 TaxID=3391898 RepID=UPI0039E9BD79
MGIDPLKNGDQVKLRPGLEGTPASRAGYRKIDPTEIGVVVDVSPLSTRYPLVAVRFGETTLPLRYARDFVVVSQPQG